MMKVIHFVPTHALQQTLQNVLFLLACNPVAAFHMLSELST